MNDHNKLLQDSTKGKKKEIAYAMGCTPNTVNREMNGEIKFNFLDKALPYMNACDNDEIINYLAASQGGVFVKVPKVTPGGGALIISELLKEFSELTAEIGESFKDGKIEAAEVVKMRKELADINSVTESFLICAERGDYDEK